MRKGLRLMHLGFWTALILSLAPFTAAFKNATIYPRSGPPEPSDLTVEEWKKALIVRHSNCPCDISGDWPCEWKMGNDGVEEGKCHNLRTSGTTMELYHPYMSEDTYWECTNYSERKCKGMYKSIKLHHQDRMCYPIATHEWSYPSYRCIIRKRRLPKELETLSNDIESRLREIGRLRKALKKNLELDEKKWVEGCVAAPPKPKPAGPLPEIDIKVTDIKNVINKKKVIDKRSWEDECWPREPKHPAIPMHNETELMYVKWQLDKAKKAGNNVVEWDVWEKKVRDIVEEVKVFLSEIDWQRKEYGEFALDKEMRKEEKYWKGVLDYLTDGKSMVPWENRQEVKDSLQKIAKERKKDVKETRKEDKKRKAALKKDAKLADSYWRYGSQKEYDKSKARDQYNAWRKESQHQWEARETARKEREKALKARKKVVGKYDKDNDKIQKHEATPGRTWRRIQNARQKQLLKDLGPQGLVLLDLREAFMIAKRQYETQLWKEESASGNKTAKELESWEQDKMWEKLEKDIEKLKTEKAWAEISQEYERLKAETPALKAKAA